MLKIKEAVIVEGKYDKLKLSNIIDALIIETNGFQIYKDKERREFIKKLANERGLIVITDSDHSGFQIRSYIASGVPKDKVKHIYIPDVFGKEKRKIEASKEGKLGVEGIDDSILLSLFEKANVEVSVVDKTDLIESFDLYDLGYAGRENSKFKKSLLLAKLDLPEFLSTNSLLSYLNSTLSKNELIALTDEIDREIE